MNRSESVAKILPALVKVQTELKAVTKDRENTFHKAKYATLDAIMEVVRPLLAANSLVVSQGALPTISPDGTLKNVTIETMLWHESGEWLSNAITIPLAKIDPQGAMAAYTYGRRGSLSALLAIATEDDDDGNTANKPGKRQALPKSTAPQPVQAANAGKTTKITDLPFPKMKNFKQWEGKPLRDVPMAEISKARREAASFGGKTADAIVKGFDEYMEFRSYDEPAAGLKPGPDELQFTEKGR